MESELNKLLLEEKNIIDIFNIVLSIDEIIMELEWYTCQTAILHPEVLTNYISDNQKINQIDKWINYMKNMNIFVKMCISTHAYKILIRYIEQFKQSYESSCQKNSH